MSWNKSDHPIVRWASFSVDHLTQIGDIELATLKVQLVVEDALRYLLAARLGLAENALIEHRIDFSPLMELALVGIADLHLIGGIKALNAARNALSHSVESPRVQKQLEIFVREIGYMKKEKVSWPASTPDQLQALRTAFDDAVGAIFDLAIVAEQKSRPATGV